ncbi:MAG: glycosyltransferase family 4 protein [Candidatus Kapaibacteriales bacterium]
MRILQLSPQFPFPKDNGGKISIANVTENMHKLGHEVVLICIVKEIPNSKLIEEAQKFANTFFFELDTTNTPLRGVRNAFQRHSVYIDKHYNEKILTEILKIANDFKPDVVHADHSNMAKYAIEVSEKLGIKSGLRLHNLEYVIWERYAKDLKSGIKKRFIERQANKLKSDEKEFLEKVDISFAITDVDKQRAKKLQLSSNVKTITAGVDDSFLDYSKNENGRIQNSLVIGSTFNWIHNINGLDWFVKDIFPSVSKAFDDCTLNLIGKHLPEKYTKIEGINSIGYVEDYKEEVTKYQVYIAPLLVGGGIRIKILEAMALGLPVIATKVSAEGINAGEKKGLYISDDPEYQSKKIIALLKDKVYRKEASINARKYIQQNHRWETLISKMSKEYEKLLQ